MTRSVLTVCLIGLFAILPSSRGSVLVTTQTAERPRLSVKLVDDFEVTGTGDNAAWRQSEWTPLRRRQPEAHPYDTRFKMLYSNTGLYFLMDGTDRKLTATMADDFMDLWNEDVYEVFLWTDERYPVYFEYEISPLGRELPILIPNFGGQFLGWRPWHYERDRVTRVVQARVGDVEVALERLGAGRGIPDVHAEEGDARGAQGSGQRRERRRLGTAGCAP